MVMTRLQLVAGDNYQPGKTGLLDAGLLTRQLDLWVTMTKHIRLMRGMNLEFPESISRM
jgi:hypothetical protein